MNTPVREGERRDDRGVPYHAESTLSSAQASAQVHKQQTVSLHRQQNYQQVALSKLHSIAAGRPETKCVSLV